MISLAVTSFVLSFSTGCLEWELGLNGVSSENFLTSFFLNIVPFYVSQELSADWLDSILIALFTRQCIIKPTERAIVSSSDSSKCQFLSAFYYSLALYALLGY